MLAASTAVEVHPVGPPDVVPARAAGADAFWRSKPVAEVLDERVPGDLPQTIHVELDVTGLVGNPGRPHRD